MIHEETSRIYPRTQACCHEKGEQVEWTSDAPFYSMNSQVTNAQYWLYDPSHKSWVDEEIKRYKKLNLISPDYQSLPNHPVIFVDYFDVLCFARWTDSRLPDEAEWEFACRASSLDDYCFGDDPDQLKEYAWFDDEFVSGGPHQVRAKATDSKAEPNPMGSSI